MAIKIGINGFGRIGRMVFRACVQNFSDIEVVGINDLLEPDYLAYMLKYDSVHGRFKGDVAVKDGNLVVNGKTIRLTQERDPANLKWGEVGADVVIEATGLFLDDASARKHIAAGAKKVLMSAPSKDSTPMFVFGVNHATYAGQDIVSNASCTTNCLAPLAKVIHQEFGIEQSLMSTIHASTAKQKAVDSRGGSDWRTGRSILNNIIPTSTGAAQAVAKVIPELKGKFTGYSLRVPTPTVSVVDFSGILEKSTDTESLLGELKEASETYLNGILAYNEKPLVSMDFKGDPHSSILEAPYTTVQEGRLVKIVAWSDNEWGYSNRVCDLACLMGAKGF